MAAYYYANVSCFVGFSFWQRLCLCDIFAVFESFVHSLFGMLVLGLRQKFNRLWGGVERVDPCGSIIVVDV